LNRMIYQLLPTLSYGDAVGNHAMAIARLLRANGYANEIYADNIHYKNTLFCQPFHNLADRIRPFDIVIYHMSTGSQMTYWFKHLACRKILIYHNITPSEYFTNYNPETANLTAAGRSGLRDLAGSVDLCIADSQYNANELMDLGYTNVHVVPIFIPFTVYRADPDPVTVAKFEDGKINIVFVGRISPNKKQEDVIAAFYEYHNNFNANSRLILVGSDAGMQTYSGQLHRYTDVLALKDDVVFTGHVSFSQILAYYHTADAFLCMSEHEGFCVPLVEAMLFDVPVFACSCGAVPDTLGDAGVVFNDRRFYDIASSINYILTHPEQKERVLQSQRNQREKFEDEAVEKRFLDCISDFLN